jgi:serine/threonine protein phosphatase PrpC
MITCPECGASNGDEVKFCDRCGQGLARALARPAIVSELPPLAVGTELKRGLFITELIGTSVHENRYRAERRLPDGAFERLQLREQLGPRSSRLHDSEEAPATAATWSTTDEDEDPAGPRAKTAELRLKVAAAPVANTSCDNTYVKGDKPATDDANGLATMPGESASGDCGTAIERDGIQSPSSANGAADATPGTAGVVTIAPNESDPSIGEPDRAAAARAPAAAAPDSPESLLPDPPPPASAQYDLGEVFGRVTALSMTLNHPAFQRAIDGFAENGRVYLVYRDEQLRPLSRLPGGLRVREADAIAFAIQVCQAVAYVNRRGLRVNDICPDSVAFGADGRIKLTGFDYISNDNELQNEPLFNDGYTAPEIYKALKVDKRADVFSVGALLYSCLTGVRLESETWRGEAGPIRFYPPHVVSPALEKAVRRALAFDPAARWPTVDALKTELLRLAGIVHLRAAALSDVGMMREVNEDSIIAVEFQRDSLIEPAENFLYVVADGMGGAEAGEMASAIAVATIRDFVETKQRSGNPSDICELLTEALEEANRKILEYQVANIESRGMGSTAVSALILPPEATIAWVGDSRAYYSDQNGLRQLTKDHSLVQRLIEIGQITPEEARHHEHKNVITRSLGARQSGPAGAEALSLRLKRGDRLLLCSDGLTAHVDDPSIGEVLRRHLDPHEAARELVVAANAGGGTDNVSVVVIFAD